MKKLSMTLLAVLAIACAFASPKELKPVVITGKVINQTAQTPQVIKFNFFDPFTDSRSIKLDDNGQFYIKQDILYAHVMTVHYLNSFINLYVQPGDSVNLMIDASLLNKAHFEWLTIGGDQAAMRTQLNLCVDYLYRLSYPENNRTLQPKDILAAIKQDYARYLNALNDYALKNQLDPEVREWARADIKYLISNMVSDYALLRTGTTADRLARIKMFNDLFFDMHSPANFKSSLFNYHLSAYASAMVGLDSTVKILYSQKRVAAALAKAAGDLLQEPVGECRDYMLYTQLKSFVKDNPGILDSVKEAGGWFTKAVYYDQLKKLSGKRIFPNTPIAGINYLTSTGMIGQIPTADVFSYLTKKYPGKVLYIDVYATWCGPCLEELSRTPALHNAMKGKGVVFINLCLASETGNWKKLVNDKHIDSENYFFNGDATKLFMGTYGLPGYPSYIIVNRGGDIVTTEASRPSELDETKLSLEKLLNEN